MPAGSQRNKALGGLGLVDFWFLPRQRLGEFTRKPNHIKKNIKNHKMDTTTKQKPYSIFDPHVYKPINFNKKAEQSPRKDSFAIRNTPKKVKTIKQVVPIPIIEETPKIPHKQLLINFFENRADLGWLITFDEHFFIGEVLWANDPASKLLMEDLINLPADTLLNYHFSPTNNRLKVFILKETSCENHPDNL
jgi:hypothetical protein